MRYQHRFEVAAPLAKVSAFHRRAASLAEITALVPLRFLVQPPVLLARGDELYFEIGRFPFRIRWRAKIEEADENGFVDVQLAGPFRSWRHRHSFVELGPARTAVEDAIDARLARNPCSALTGLALWWGLPLLFALRGRATRRKLEGAEP